MEQLTRAVTSSAAEAGMSADEPDSCICADTGCPESDSPCPWCRENLDIYDPCPVIGFGCGTAGNTTRCDCCTDAQWIAAGGAP